MGFGNRHRLARRLKVAQVQRVIVLRWMIYTVFPLFLLAGVFACRAAPPIVTIGQLAEKGATVYSNRCAKCHGADGQGLLAPPLIGETAGLKKYETAQNLLTYLSSSMPFDAPGSLSTEEYSDVLSYLLLQNQFASGGVEFKQNELSHILLK